MLLESGRPAAHRVFRSPSTRLRLEQVDQFLARQNPAAPLLVLGSTWGVADEAIRRQPRATFGWFRLSVPELWRRLARPLCLKNGYHPLTRLSAWACLQQALQLAPPARYASLVPYPGFSLILQRTLAECRLQGVLPDRHLAPVAEAYAEILQREKLADEADLKRLAREALAEEPWVRSLQALVCIDLEWDPLLEQLCSLIPAVLRVEAGSGEDLGALACLRANLFGSSSARPNQDGRAVETISANHQTAESLEIAREIHKLADAGYRWDEIAIFLRQPEAYVYALHSALERAGVPAYFTPGLRRPCPEGRAFVALLQCAQEDLSARCFNEYLSLGQLPRDVYRGEAEEDAQRPARELPLPYRWQELIGNAGVIRGSRRWLERLESVVAQRLQQMELLLREEPESPKIEGFQQDVQQLRKLQEFALPVLQRLEGYRVPRSWGDWRAELEELAREALATPDPVLHLLQELAPLSQLGDIPLSQVVATLKPELVQLRRRSSGHRHGKVFIGSLEEAAGRTFRAVFLPGLAERRFPPPLREDPLLSEEERSERGLPTLAEQAEREKDLLRSALGACEEKLLLTFPRRDAQYNRPLLPSLYLLEVLRAYRGELVTPQHLLDHTGRPELPEPEQAIDASEESLAWLKQPSHAPGSHRFLVERSPFVRRGLKSLAERQSPRWLKADGCVSMPGCSAVAPKKRAYSASNLQRFAECPYQFWLYSAYRLLPREEAEPLEELDALTRGSLLHEVHARLVWRAPGQAATRDELLTWLGEELQRVAAEWAARQLVLMPRVYQDEVEQLGREFAHWLETYYDPEWVPIHAELAFQLSDDLNRDPASKARAARLGRDYRLRGSIDRVELSRRDTLRIVDLKTGKVSVSYGFQLEKGKVLQPALYALAAETELGKTVERSSLEFCTARGGYQSRYPRDLRQAMDAALDALEKLDEAADIGHFPAYPGDGACSRCDYRRVCGGRAEQWSDGKGPDATVTGAADWWRNQR